MRILTIILSISIFLPYYWTNLFQGKKLAEAAIPSQNDLPNTNCGDFIDYAPNAKYPNQFPPRKIKVNFHIIQKNDGTANFPEAEARDYIRSLMVTSNERIWKNNKMDLPAGNNIPVLSGRYLYLITPDKNIPGDDGIYFHRSDSLYPFINKGKEQNDYKKTVFERYGKQKGEVLNIFLMSHHEDSIKSPTYKGGHVGIAFPRENWLKVGGCYSVSKDTVYENGKARVSWGWSAAGILNHEVGHVLGLRHTWSGYDSCKDTPVHPNCFGPSKKSPCNEGPTSNNVMDYNMQQNAWTPCQLGKVHYNFANKKSSQRKVLVKSWCELKEFRKVIVSEDMTWNAAKDLEGHIVVESGASLSIRCRVSLPKGGEIVVNPGARLILDGCTLENDCGENWAGIKRLGWGRQKGVVEFLNEPRLNNVE